MIVAPAGMPPWNWNDTHCPPSTWKRSGETSIWECQTTKMWSLSLIATVA